MIIGKSQDIVTKIYKTKLSSQGDFFESKHKHYYIPKYSFLYLSNNLLYFLFSLFNFISTKNSFILNNIFIFIIPFVFICTSRTGITFLYG